MIVRTRNPTGERTLTGPLSVAAVLDALDVNPETVIVIRGGELITSDVSVADTDEIELRPVISGGAL